MKNGPKIFLTLALIVLSAVSIIACGSGGGGETVTPPAQSLEGTYSFTSFLVVFSDGTIFTPDDVNASGTMKIGSNTITQSFVFDGIPLAFTATYTVTYTSGTSEGFFTFTESSGLVHTVYFWISGLNLTTYSGIVDTGVGLTFEEWDTWTKTSDSLQAAIVESQANQVPETAFRWIGELLK